MIRYWEENAESEGQNDRREQRKNDELGTRRNQNRERIGSKDA